jgi:hypothetical protein
MAVALNAARDTLDYQTEVIETLRDTLAGAAVHDPEAGAAAVSRMQSCVCQSGVGEGAWIAR